jgi:hypothetical protein
MPVKAGQIVIDITAGTQKFVVDMEAASAKIRQVGKEAHGAVSGVQAVSGTLRVMEGNVTNNLRAAERWVASLPGVANALKAAFPVVGAMAFAGVISELGGKVRNFFKEVQEAPAKINDAFRALSEPLRTTNDQLQLANDRLENDIAKLEGKRQNNLKIALDEARVAADQLADSLDKSLGGLTKLLREESISKWRTLGTALVPGMKTSIATTPFAEWMGGATGNGGKKGEFDAGLDGFTDQMRATKDPAQQEAIKAAARKWIAEKFAALQKAIDDGVKGAGGFEGLTANRMAAAASPRADYRGIIESQTQAKRFIAEMARGAQEQFSASDLTQKKDALTANAENAQLDRPFEDRMKALSAQLDGVKAKLAAVGQGEAAQTVARSFAEAQKAIEEVNKALEKHHTKLTADQEAQVRSIEQSIAAAEAEATWREKLESATTSINDRIESQQLLTAAIGKGYEATKQANVETQLMSTLGQHYNDPAWMQQHAGEVSGLRSGFGQEYDAKHGEQVATAVDGLNRQIQLEKDLAAAQSQGAEVVRQITLVSKLRQMVVEGATREQVKAEIELYNAERRNASAAAVTAINQKIAATQALTAAVFEGAEAQRKAGLESKYGEMALGGDSPDQIAAARRLDSAEHTKAITEEAGKTVTAYSDQLDKLNQIEAALQAQKKDHGDTLELETALRDIENQRLQLAVQEELKLRGAKDGIKAFFLEMQEDAKSAANIIYDSLNSALDKVSDQFSKLLTGKKTSWGKAFESLGQDMVKESTKSIMQKGLGALGKSLGIHPPTGKPDGTQMNPYYVVMQGAKSGVPGSAAGTPADPTAAAGGAVAKGALGALGASVGGWLGKLFGSGGGGTAVSSSISFMAGGGDADPGRVYGVAEAGEAELISPKNSSRITPISKLGGTHYHSYSIDARGADLGAENRVARAIEFAHNSAVSSGVRANSERAKRTPKRS